MGHEILQDITNNFFVYVSSLLAVLIVVVSLHEAGHYFAARLCNVRVDKFSFGFGKELFGFGGKNGKTRWSFCIFPLGGYIKIFGDVDPADPKVWDEVRNEARSMNEEELSVAFCTKSVYQRMFIVFAGPAVNLILTFLVFVSMFTLYGERSKPVFINTILIGSESDKAGIKLGDQITEMNGKAIRRLEDIYQRTWHDLPPKVNEYTIIRDGEELKIEFAARHVIYENKQGVPMSHGQTGMVRMYSIALEDIKGINGKVYDSVESVRKEIIKNLDQVVIIHAPFEGKTDMELQEHFRTVFSTKNNQHLNDPEHKDYDFAFVASSKERFFVRLPILEASGQALYKMKAGLENTYKLMRATLYGKNDNRIFAGVGKLSESTGEAFKAGFYDFVMMLAIFSYMIAIVNLLPIPGLDGGYLVFFLFEMVTGKPVSQKFQSITLILGLALLWGIMVFANVSDVLFFLNDR